MPLTHLTLTILWSYDIPAYSFPELVNTPSCSPKFMLIFPWSVIPLRLWASLPTNGSSSKYRHCLFSAAIRVKTLSAKEPVSAEDVLKPSSTRVVKCLWAMPLISTKITTKLLDKVLASSKLNSRVSDVQ